MYTKEQLIMDLEKSGINKTGTLMVHSSMKAIGEVEGGAETVVSALMTYMKDGLLLMPTHTWSDQNLVKGVYDYKNEPSCVGLLTNIFMKRPEVWRSLHPTHSVAAYGRRAFWYVSMDDRVIEEGISTPCHTDGCFGSLYREDAQILMLGAPLTSFTYVHCVEERLNLPNLLSKEPRFIDVINRDNKACSVEVYGHMPCEPPYNASSFFGCLYEPLLTAGALRKTTFGNAKCFLINTRLADQVVEGLLVEEPKLLTSVYNLV